MSENNERSSKSRTVRDLGEGRSIPRRDFVQGALAASATVLAGPLLKAYGADAAEGQGAAQDAPGYYPPPLNGMRGSQPGAFEGAHALRDGDAAPQGGDPREAHDLGLGGARSRGLAAAPL